MIKALLIGEEPRHDLGYTYVKEGNFDAVVIGSLTLSQAVHFNEDQALNALAQGKPVVLYTPGFPDAPRCRGLSAALASARREMKSWGILFTDGAQRRLVTAQEARQMRLAGNKPGPGSVLTPLAREILEGSD